MTRASFIAERVRRVEDKAVRGADRALRRHKQEVSRLASDNRRAALADAAREHIEQALATMPEPDAGLYLAELMRAVRERMQPPKAPAKPSLADQVFGTGRAAA